MRGATEILPGIFIGDANVARDAAFFHAHNIQLVINCTKTVPFYFDNVERMRIHVDDSSDYTNQQIMANALPTVVSHILDFKTHGRGNVLVHCYAGISRSCTIGVGILRTCCSKNIYQAISMLIARRPCAFLGGTYLNFKSALFQVYHN